MTTVHNGKRRGIHHFETAGPTGGGDACESGLVGDGPPAPAQHVDRRQGQRRVERLVAAEQTRLESPPLPREPAQGRSRERLHGQVAEVGHEKFATALGGHGLDDRHGLALLGPAHHGRSRLHDAGLLAGDGAQGIPEQIGMVEPDAADHARLGGLDDVGGVQPPPEPHFQHHDIAAHGAEMLEGHRRHELELRRMIPARRLHGRGRRTHRRNGPGQLLARDVFPVHTDALLEAKDERAREQAHLVAGRLQHRGHIRAHRPLPVGTRHVHEAQLVLGAPQALQQIHHAREPQARGLPARGVYPGYGIEVARIFHGTFSFNNAATVFLQTR